MMTFWTEDAAAGSLMHIKALSHMDSAKQEIRNVSWRAVTHIVTTCKTNLTIPVGDVLIILSKRF